MNPSSNDVHVWYRLTGQLDSSALDAALAILSPREREHHERLRVATDRRDYAAAHALLRASLSCYADVPPHAWCFETDRRGKPTLSGRCAPGSRLTFSLSHTRGLVACAIAFSAAVGIDVERADPDVDWSPVVRRCFSPGEIAQLEHCPALDRAGHFADLWTLKEAYAKATGSGLSDSWPASGFDLSGGRIAFSPPPTGNAESWQFALFTPAHPYRMAVAVEGRRTEPPAIIARSAAHQENRNPWPELVPTHAMERPRA